MKSSFAGCTEISYLVFCHQHVRACSVSFMFEMNLRLGGTLPSYHLYLLVTTRLVNLFIFYVGIDRIKI